ncbi:MAG: PAQR family membrane homeostasis protein TrhA [Acidiferrobacter sp.]
MMKSRGGAQEAIRMDEVDADLAAEPTLEFSDVLPLAPAERCQSREEEWINAALHGLGAIAALVVGTILTRLAAQTNDLPKLLCAAIFSLAMVGLYAVSAAYHILPTGPLKERFQRLDRMAIALFIAGTYIPVAALLVRGATGAVLVVTECALAGLAILLLWGAPERYLRRSEYIYQVMGWTTILGAAPFFRHTPLAVLVALGLSGACYGIGVVFLVRDRVKYFHAAFHVLTLVGASLQFWAISRFVT